MNIETTLVIILGLVSISIAIALNNFFDRYNRKMAKVKTALLGLLEDTINQLVENKSRGRGAISFEKNVGENLLIKKEQEKKYIDFITFMKNTRFLKYANEHEECIEYETSGERKIYAVSILIFSFIGPTYLLQQEHNLYIFGFFWLIFSLVMLIIQIIDLCYIIRRIDTLYKGYIIDKASFGGYDL